LKPLYKNHSIFKLQLQTSTTHQALAKLHRVAPDTSWGQSVNSLLDFIRLLLTVEDSLLPVRVRTVLLDQHHGLAAVAASER
jgi:hypothetical protein